LDTVQNNRPLDAFVAGLRAAVPVVVSYFPVGMTFGLLARSALIPLGPTSSFSLFVFAGASQFMAVNMLALGTGPGHIVLATFLLNLRHFLMSSALADRLRRSRVLALIAFGVTDETFAVAASRPGPLTGPFLVGLEGAAWAAWNTGTLTGYLAGTLLPSRIQEAMGIGLYALFIALLVSQARAESRLLLPAALAATVHWLLILLGLEGGWAIVAALVTAPLMCVVVFPEKQP
jgi:4-azaleucine resistance transporter AzlC